MKSHKKKPHSNCEGKKIYPSKQAAEKGKFGLGRRGTPVNQYDAYYCDKHQGWHVGRKPYRGKT